MDKVLLVAILGGVGYIIYKEETREEKSIFKPALAGTIVGGPVAVGLGIGGTYLVGEAIRRTKVYMERRRNIQFTRFEEY